MRISPRRQSLCTAAFAALALACSHVTEPSVPLATVVVQRDTLVASVVTADGVEWMTFTVPVSIQNTTSAPLMFDHCVSSIETQRTGDWQVVWQPGCLLSLSSTSPALIQPGETRVVPWTVTAAIQGSAGPLWGNASVSGVYRIAAGLIPSGFVGQFPKVASNAFTLVRAN